MRRYNCPGCNYNSDSSLSFQAHIWTRHDGYSGIECAFCGTTMKELAKLTNTTKEAEDAYRTHMQSCTVYAASMLTGKVIVDRGSADG